MQLGGGILLWLKIGLGKTRWVTVCRCGWCGRLIQEEKETAELRAEELESRVAVDTLPANWRPEVVYDRSSPPLSGRSTPSPRPSLQSHDYLHKYHTLNSAVSHFLTTDFVIPFFVPFLSVGDRITNRSVQYSWL